VNWGAKIVTVQLRSGQLQLLDCLYKTIDHHNQNKDDILFPLTHYPAALLSNKCIVCHGNCLQGYSLVLVAFLRSQHFITSYKLTVFGEVGHTHYSWVYIASIRFQDECSSASLSVSVLYSLVVKV
jgi:hypothetical protein